MEINEIKIAILEILNSRHYSSSAAGVMGVYYEAKKNKYNLIGRRGSGNRGDVEYRLDTYFSDQDRVLASKAFEELKGDGYIESTLDDLVDPENWVIITELGIEKLKRGFVDEIDECLKTISPHLLEIRQGMWDAVKRNSPDSCRQAAHSARELVDQVLRIVVSDPKIKERKQRSRIVMKKFRGKVSKSDIQIVDAHFKIIDSEHNKLIKLAHSAGAVERSEVQESLESAERILRLLFGKG